MAPKFPCTNSNEFFELFVWALNACNHHYPGQVVRERSGNQAWRAARSDDGRGGRVFRGRLAIYQTVAREQGKSWLAVDPSRYPLISLNPTYASSPACPVVNSRDYLKYVIYAAKGAVHYHGSVQHPIEYQAYREDGTPYRQPIDVPYVDWSEQFDELGKPLFVADCTVPLLSSEAAGSSWGNLDLSILTGSIGPVPAAGQPNLFGA
jgi:hypothetical protein